MSYIKPLYYNTLKPYRKLKHDGIEYTVCRDYNHISRYKGLRQIVHQPKEQDRYIAPETPNPISSHAEYFLYEVPLSEENRLDLIANRFYGSAQYSWVVSYLNDIEDGFTVHEGQRVKILRNFTDLFSKGEIFASIPAMILNLGSE